MDDRTIEQFNLLHGVIESLQKTVAIQNEALRVAGEAITRCEQRLWALEVKRGK